jgi:hypothetical protein
MTEDIPKSVVKAVKAAVKDVVAAMNGGSYAPMNLSDKHVSHMENFMLGMVSSHYPRGKSQWVDSSLDNSWIKSAGKPGIDSAKIVDAINKYIESKGLEGSAARAVEREFTGKYIGTKKTEEMMQKNDPELYGFYSGSSFEKPSMVEGLPKDIPDLSIDLDVEPETKKPEMPESAGATGSTSKNEKMEGKQQIRKPGDVSGTDEMKSKEKIFNSDPSFGI